MAHIQRSLTNLELHNSVQRKLLKLSILLFAGLRRSYSILAEAHAKEQYLCPVKLALVCS